MIWEGSLITLWLLRRLLSNFEISRKKWMKLLTQCSLQWIKWGKKERMIWLKIGGLSMPFMYRPLILQTFYHDSDNLLSKIFPFVWIWQNSYSAFSSGSPSSNKQNLWTLDWRKSKFLTFGKFIRPLPIWVDNNEETGSWMSGGGDGIFSSH